MQAVQIDIADFAAQLRDDIAANRIKLPSLPEVALMVRDAVESESATAQQIAQLISQDVALSTRLLQVANSPRYRGRVEVDSIQMAVTRLGTKLVRNLVTSLAMKQIFQTSSSVLDQHFRRVWDDSVDVAAIAHYLADGVPHLEAEQAMLGGLLHNIGALPVLARMQELGNLDLNDRLIDALLEELAPDVGTQVMEAWRFPSSLTSVPKACLELQRDPGPQVDYVDVVLAARLQHLLAAERVAMQADLADLPAFRKLGIQVEVMTLEDDGTGEKLDQTRSVLQI